MADETAMPQGPYTLWENHGCYEGWSFRDFATIDEALRADRYAGQWHISRPVQYQIVEATMTRQTADLLDSRCQIAIEVSAPTRAELMAALVAEMDKREIPADGREYLCGWQGGPWPYDERLPECVAVVWHRSAIVPPALVLQGSAIIHGAAAAL